MNNKPVEGGITFHLDPTSERKLIKLFEAIPNFSGSLRLDGELIFAQVLGDDRDKIKELLESGGIDKNGVPIQFSIVMPRNESQEIGKAVPVREEEKPSKRNFDVPFNDFEDQGGSEVTHSR